MSEDDAQAPSMNPMAKVGPSQKGPSLRVPGGAKETMAMKDKDMPEFRLSVPAFRNGNQVSYTADILSDLLCVPLPVAEQEALPPEGAAEP